MNDSQSRSIRDAFNHVICDIERRATSSWKFPVKDPEVQRELDRLRELRDRVVKPEPDRQEGDADHIRHRKMIDAMRREERTRIRKMIDKTALSLLDSDLDHDVPSELNATDTILSVLEIVKVELTWGICTDAFRHLYPESKPVTVPEPVDLSALKEHLDDYPVDPSVQEGLDQATRGELVAEPDLSATEASDVAVHILEGRSEEEVFAIVDEVCKRLRPKPIGVSYLLGISTPPSYIDMVRKHHQRAWEAVSDEIWAKSEPDNQYGIPYFIDTAAEPPEPPKDWDGYIKLRVNSKTGLESVQPAYFEPLVRRMMHDNTWMSGSNICDLRTGKSYYLEIVFTDDDGAVTARRTV